MNPDVNTPEVLMKSPVSAENSGAGARNLDMRFRPQMTMTRLPFVGPSWFAVGHGAPGWGTAVATTASVICHDLAVTERADGVLGEDVTASAGLKLLALVTRMFQMLKRSAELLRVPTFTRNSTLSPGMRSPDEPAAVSKRQLDSPCLVGFHPSGPFWHLFMIQRSEGREI